jgi:hypothetical protein
MPHLYEINWQNVTTIIIIIIIIIIIAIIIIIIRFVLKIKVE